ncbi:hypothetical protein Tco_1098000 [Tanacetum coccineum]
MEECYRALSDKLDWNNPEGDQCPYDLTKPLPLHRSPGRLTISFNFFSITILNIQEREIQKDNTLHPLPKQRLQVDKQLGYSYLKEIVVRRVDQKLYKFIEGDFPRLHLNDIKDMLLLHVQNKLSNLEGDVIVDLVVALSMFTRRYVIQKRVEDLQLGVESF